MRIFCELRIIFPSPAGARKNASNKQNVRSYYMLSHRIRGLLFHYKKTLSFCNWLLFCFGFQSVKLSTSSSLSCLISVCSVKSVPVDKSSSSLKKSSPKDPNKSKLGSCPVSHNCSFIRRYSPCCKLVKLGHYSVLRSRSLRLLLSLYGKMT